MHFKVAREDIVDMVADAIVNAANSSLLGGGGVDGAIHRAGGPAILEECKAIRNRQGGCKTGEAVITTAGNLYAKYVIHTVGPVWNGGNNGEDMLLASCYRNSMLLAEQHGVKTIAFPAISTGIYKFPKERAAQVAMHTLYEFKDSSVEMINFVCFDPQTAAIYSTLLH